MTIYGENELEGVCIFVGEFPAGKILDIRATEKAMKKSLDAAIFDKCGEYPDDEDDTYWLYNRSVVAEKLLASEEWYDDNYVWINK